MRIIITNVGEKERLELLNIISPSASSQKIMRKQSKVSHQFNPKKDKSLSNEPRGNIELPNQIKLIKLHNVNQSKLTPEFIKDKIDKKFNESMLKIRNELLPKQKEEPTFKMPIKRINTIKRLHSQQKIYLIKDIINHSAYNDMLVKLKKEINQNEKNYAMNQNNFRSTTNQTFQESSYDILHTPIKSSKGEFLNYMMNKTRLTPLFLKKVASVNESRIIKLNKICKIMKENLMKELTRKEKIEEMNKAKQVTVGSILKKSLDEMYKQVTNQNIVIRSYKKKCLKNRKIDFAYLDRTQHYWKKYEVDKLQRRIKSKSLNSIDDSLIDNETLKKLSNIKNINNEGFNQFKV